jgi:hypothetical protein
MPWWHAPVKPASQEAGTIEWQFEVSPGKISLRQTKKLKPEKQKNSEYCSSGRDLPSNPKTLSSIPSTTKQKEKENL